MHRGCGKDYRRTFAEIKSIKTEGQKAEPLTMQGVSFIMSQYDMRSKGVLKMTEEVLLTQEGYNKIIAEIEELTAVKRKEVAEKLKEAIAQGDISENADYDAAKNEQAELEERILKLENMERKAKIIDENDVDDKMVGVGLKVKVRCENTKEEEEYVIVGATEADPFEGRISNESPVGSSLLGHKVGETVTIEVQDGLTVTYTILGIRK